jgi:hypothetical protein
MSTGQTTATDHRNPGEVMANGDDSLDQDDDLSAT